MLMPTWLLGKRSVTTETSAAIWSVKPQVYGATEFRSGAGRQDARCRARRRRRDDGSGSWIRRDNEGRRRRRARWVVAGQPGDLGRVGQVPAVVRTGDDAWRSGVPAVAGHSLERQVDELVHTGRGDEH